jgi:uncharacterized membrane protein YphA (DoxX/SURF4 family)
MTDHTDRAQQPEGPSARQFLASALAVAPLAAGAGKLIDPDIVTDTLDRDGVLIPTTVLQLLGVVELLCAALLTLERATRLAARVAALDLLALLALLGVHTGGTLLLAPLLLLALCAPLLQGEW